MAKNLSLKASINKDTFSFLCGGLLGIIAFCVLYGTHIVNPNYVEWIFDNGRERDISQHFFGWVFFRLGNWSWPLGMTDALSYPLTSSVVFTDSIPLFACVFKLFGSLLPATFQYFGCFVLISFILQGAFATLIIKRLTGNILYSLVATPFFLVLPILSLWFFVATALGANWLILWALPLYLCFPEFSFRKTLWQWISLLWLAAGIHITLLAICGIILGFSCLSQWHLRPPLHSAIMLTVPVLVAGLMLYVYGALTSETNPIGSVNDQVFLGRNSCNVNSLINPFLPEFSCMLPSLGFIQFNPNAVVCDGFAYLGIGIILLASTAFVGQIIRLRQNKPRLRYGRWVWTSIMVVALFVFSLSPTVVCGDNIIFQYHPPKPILFVWEAFRACGRFIWPVFYLIYIGAIVGTYRLIRNKIITFSLISMALTLQLVDVGPGTFSHSRTAVTPHCALRPLSEDWDSILSNTNNICFSSTFNIVAHPELLQLAQSHANKINYFFFAHANNNYCKRVTAHAHANALSPNDTTLYVFMNEPSSFIDSCIANLYIRELDGYLIGTTFPSEI